MSEVLDRFIAKAATVAVFGLCLTESALFCLSYAYRSRFANDFGVYWRTANMPVELAYLWSGRFPFPYAPTMLLWIQPLAIMPKWPAFFLFVTFSTVAFVLAVRPYLSKTAIALCLVSPPFTRGIATGQVSAALAALMLWACGTGNRIAAGVAFGFVASVKPQLVIMAPLMFALNRDRRAFIASAATFLALVVLSVVIFGGARWPEWLASMDHFHGAVADTRVILSGATPAMTAERFGLPPLPFMLGGAAMGSLIVYSCRNEGPLEKTAAITLGSLLAAPYALTYDLIGVVPVLALAALRSRVWTALAIAGYFQPLPIVISTFELLSGKFPKRKVEQCITT